MNRIAVAVVLAAMGLAAPSWAATDAECQELWKKADANSDGVLSEGMTKRMERSMAQDLPGHYPLGKAPVGLWEVPG